jgi:4a-hydroxytetrahydrobiopterin dehydratase
MRSSLGVMVTVRSSYQSLYPAFGTLLWHGSNHCGRVLVSRLGQYEEIEMVERLSAAARQAALKELTGWAEVKGRDAIARTFTFKDFSEAFGFMARSALIAEKSDHHPEWSNVYKTVEVLLSTHDADGVTARDVALAKTMNAIAAQLGHA